MRPKVRRYLRAMQWTAADERAFEARGWTRNVADEQVALLHAGADLARAVRPATLGDGIAAWSEGEMRAFRGAARGTWARFIPASGAATRMFAGFEGPDRVRTLARWAEAAHRTGLVQGTEDADAVVRRWSHLPKGFLPFLRADAGWLTAFEAHAAENLLGHPPATLHFSIAAAHREAASEHLAGAQWHLQPASTDTLAWDLEANTPARTAEGALRFRPGGHGALIGLLAGLPSEGIFIRNVDNVVPLDRMEQRAAWADALAGHAVQLARERDALFAQLEDAEGRAAAWKWLTSFAQHPLADAETLRAALDRPIRVAGMVRAAGQVGGGPFWVKAGGAVRLGILEGAEVPEGLAAGTHFNPVELACVTSLPSGRTFLPVEFSNPAACFTSSKVVEGRRLRILEHPGLWNGAMEGWLTRFVELPPDLFRPVKTWEDLIPT